MAGRPRSIPDNKVFDVSKPGKSKPMGTSRPVIVNHGTLVQDRTVVDKPEAKREPLSAPSVTRKTITPITASDTKEEAVAVDTAPVTTEETPEEPTEPVIEETPKKADKKVSDDTPVEEVAAEEETAPEAEAEPEEKAAGDEPAAEEKPEPEEETSTEDADAPAGSESGNVDALAEATEKKKTDSKEEEERIKRDTALQGLIDSKQYVVPIAHDSGKSGHKGVWVLLILLLLVAGAYAAIDAGAVDVNVELPYHFFKQ